MNESELGSLYQKLASRENLFSEQVCTGINKPGVLSSSRCPVIMADSSADGLSDEAAKLLTEALRPPSTPIHTPGLRRSSATTESISSSSRSTTLSSSTVCKRSEVRISAKLRMIKEWNAAVLQCVLFDGLSANEIKFVRKTAKTLRVSRLDRVRGEASLMVGAP